MRYILSLTVIHKNKSRARESDEECFRTLITFTVAVETDIEEGNPKGSNCVAMNPVFRAEPTSDKLEFEFPKHDLVEILTLGNGAYGHAFLAKASGIQDNEKDSMVVVKSLRSKEDRVQQEFKEEMEALLGLQHTNVVSLLGVCTLEEPAYIIYELVEKVCIFGLLSAIVLSFIDICD